MSEELAVYQGSELQHKDNSYSMSVEVLKKQVQTVQQVMRQS